MHTCIHTLLTRLLFTLFVFGTLSSYSPHPRPAPPITLSPISPVTPFFPIHTVTPISPISPILPVFPVFPIFPVSPVFRAPLLPPATVPDTPAPIRVLIVDGFSNHNWRQTTLRIREILEETGRFRVDVSTIPILAAPANTPSTPASNPASPAPVSSSSSPSPSSPASPASPILAPASVPSSSLPSSALSPSSPLLTDSSWCPHFENYDVVIQNTNNIETPSLRWPRPTELALENYVKAGGGLYILHSANNAFPHWKEYDRMIGLGWRPKETGWALEIDSTGRKIIRIPPGQGDGTNHGDRTDAIITILRRHPINKGFPARWKTASTEIYRFPRGPAENLEVLSYAYDSASHTRWPMEWTVRYSRGRVYSSSLGHLWKDQTYPSSYQSVDFRTLVVRVTEWLATGRTSFPVPPDFPGAATPSLRPPSSQPPHPPAP